MGAATGGVAGGVIGLLAGIGALAIPGVGPLIAAGPNHGGAKRCGYRRGDPRDRQGRIGPGIPEIFSKRYEEKLKAGNYLISVHTSDGDEEDRAKEIFKDAR